MNDFFQISNLKKTCHVPWILCINIMSNESINLCVIVVKKKTTFLPFHLKKKLNRSDCSEMSENNCVYIDGCRDWCLRETRLVNVPNISRWLLIKQLHVCHPRVQCSCICFNSNDKLKLFRWVSLKKMQSTTEVTLTEEGNFYLWL